MPAFERELEVRTSKDGDGGDENDTSELHGAIERLEVVR
jgi:hypothetical protein